MAKLDVIAEECQYAGYLEKYVTYPPNGSLPLFGNTDPTTDPNDPCDVWSLIHDAALLVNPGFNYYRIFDGVRTPSPAHKVLHCSDARIPIVAHSLGHPRLSHRGHVLAPV